MSFLTIILTGAAAIWGFNSLESGHPFAIAMFAICLLAAIGSAARDET